jgi:DNA-binding response OmpR family regulator
VTGEEDSVADVLLIEHDQPHLRLIGWALRDGGIDCEVAGSVQEAVERAPQVTPRVIVFNTGLPDEAKRACIEHLRDLVPGTRIIDLATPGRQPHAPTGADAYLRTPLYPDKVYDVVRLLLDQEPGSRDAALPPPKH